MKSESICVWVFFIEIDIDALYWLQMGYSRCMDVVNNMSPVNKMTKIGFENTMNWMHELDTTNNTHRHYDLSNKIFIDLLEKFDFFLALSIHLVKA